MRPIQWHLKNNWWVPETLEKGDSNTKVIAPTFTMVAARGQCPYRPTITPIKHDLQMFTDASKAG